MAAAASTVSEPLSQTFSLGDDELGDVFRARGPPDTPPTAILDLDDVNTSGPSFRLQAQTVHLTYRGWLDRDILLDKLDKIGGGVHAFSICHENGGHGQYEHTHALIHFKRKPDIRDPRAFDIEGTHPHVKLVRSKTHAQRIVQYHTKENVRVWTSNTVIWTTLGSRDKSELMDLVLSQPSWHHVLRHPVLGEFACKSGHLKWFEELWRTRRCACTIADERPKPGWQLTWAVRILDGDLAAMVPFGLQRAELLGLGTFHASSNAVGTQQPRLASSPARRSYAEARERPGGRDDDRRRRHVRRLDGLGRPGSPPRGRSDSDPSVDADAEERARLDAVYALVDKERLVLGRNEPRAFATRAPRNRRHVLWFYEEEGATGKSWFANWLVAMFDAFYTTGGKRADLAHMWRTHVDAGGTHMVVIDLPRNQKEHPPYQFMEEVLNGRVTSTKYQGTTVVTGSVPVIVFANWAPHVDQMSLDRWIVIKL